VADPVRLQREAEVKFRGVFWLLIVLAISGAVVWSVVQWRRQPPEVLFTAVTRATIHNAVSTNGKVEPVEWATARAERPGAVQKILVQRGQRVAKEAPLVELDSTDARADLAAAQARIAQIRADLDVLERGGRATDLAEISSGLDRARLDLQVAQKDYDALKRLESKQAATAFDVAAAKERIDRAQLQIRSLEDRKKVLVSGPDKSAAQARLQEAEAAVTQAQQRIRTAVIRAPIEGVIYEFDLKPGAYLNAGDSVATIGRLDRVRVKVFVDEPDLGRVQKGMPVAITWDALPGREWTGAVDRTASQIIALGTRQVGEIACLIQNPDRDLLPGTNVTVDVRSQTVEDTLTVPKEAVRTQSGQSGVFVLAGDHLEWKKVMPGIANTTRIQVDGLKEGDLIAVSSDKPLRDGLMVKAILP
jgi:multidrug efflux pump subunit AcrA (membrane-fusion protein)